MSPQYPHGVVVPVDGNHHTTAVRWRQWEDDGWYTNRGQGTIDVVPGRDTAPLDFMLPYPASVLKLMVNFGVLRLVDQGVVRLDDTYDYQPTTLSSLCGGPSSNTVRGYIDASLTFSSNAASCAIRRSPIGMVSAFMASNMSRALLRCGPERPSLAASSSRWLGPG